MHLETRGGYVIPTKTQVQKRVDEISETGCWRMHSIAGANLLYSLECSSEALSNVLRLASLFFWRPGPANQIAPWQATTGRSSDRADCYPLVSGLR